MYNPNEVADNLKKSGAYIPGIRPGEQSAKYIDNVLTRLNSCWFFIYGSGLFDASIFDCGN